MLDDTFVCLKLPCEMDLEKELLLLLVSYLLSNDFLKELKLADISNSFSIYVACLVVQCIFCVIGVNYCIQ